MNRAILQKKKKQKQIEGATIFAIKCHISFIYARTHVHWYFHSVSADAWMRWLPASRAMIYEKMFMFNEIQWRRVRSFHKLKSSGRQILLKIHTKRMERGQRKDTIWIESN